MSKNAHLLVPLCDDLGTRHYAERLLRIAEVKTGPGSGRDLGEHSVGLPAICAYIASMRLVGHSMEDTQLADLLFTFNEG